MTRLDVELVRRGLVASRTRARAAILAGSVLVEGNVVTRAAQEVGAGAKVEVSHEQRYVSRAAHKLLGALADTGLRPRGRALDAGASTGGFTQVLLECGCASVYAFDVGHGQIAATLREDPRVRVREGLNLRDLVLADVDDEPVDVLVADVSFISLKLLLAPLLAVLRPDGWALLLVKPQFEVGRERLGEGGIVTDPRHRAESVAGIVAAAAELGWPARWTGESRLPGAGGNVEYFALLSRSGAAEGGDGAVPDRVRP